MRSSSVAAAAKILSDLKRLARRRDKIRSQLPTNSQKWRLRRPSWGAARHMSARNATRLFCPVAAVQVAACEPDGRAIPAPLLRLQGAWLQCAGFGIGVPVKVHVSRGRRVIGACQWV
jgi:hypothetical protein